MVATHPRLTRPDQISSSEDRLPTPVLDDTAYAGWTFDQPSEQQPGEWTFAFIHAGRVLASKTFTITPPMPPVPYAR